MGQIQQHSFRISGALLFCLLAGCSSPSTPQPSLSSPQVNSGHLPSTHVDLEKPLHFSTPDGGDVLVLTGGYHAEFAGEKQLRLIPDRDDRSPLIVAVVKAPSDIEVPVPAATLVPEEQNPDLWHLVLVLPDKTAWVAVASASGIQPRGIVSGISKLPPSATTPGVSQFILPLPPTPQYSAYADSPLQLLLLDSGKRLDSYRHLYKEGPSQGLFYLLNIYHLFLCTGDCNLRDPRQWPFKEAYDPRKVFSTGQSTIYWYLPDGHVQWSKIARPYEYEGLPYPYVGSMSVPELLDGHLASVAGFSLPPAENVYGHSWSFVGPFGGHYDGLIYFIHPKNGDLLWYRHHWWEEAPHGVPSWEGPVKVGIGWDNFSHVFAGCEGVIYAIRPNGDLLWYRHHGYKIGAGLDWKGAWEGPKPVIGNLRVRAASASCAGYIYVVDHEGTLRWYHHPGYMTGTPGLTDLGEVQLPPDSFWKPRIKEAYNLIVMQP